MRRLPCLALLSLSACAATARPAPAQLFAKPRPVLAPLVPASLEPARPRLDEQAQRAFHEARLPSLAVGVVAGGQLAWSKYLGTRDPTATDLLDSRSVFRIASVTKLFTGLALLQLRDAGKLDFDAPAARYLAVLAEVVYPTRDSPPITVRHLVTHTSGIPRVGTLDYTRADRVASEADVLAALRGVVLESTPGTAVSYSNLAVAAAGLIVERVSGEPYTDYVERHLLAPLGITSAAWEASAVPAARLAAGHAGSGGSFKPIPAAAHWKQGASAAMGALYLDLEDLARFAAFELGAWPPRDEPEAGPVKRSTVRESQLPAGAPAGAETFGVNWVVRNDPKLGHVVWHNGSTAAYSASVWLLPRRGLGVVALSGCPEYAALDKLARSLLETAAASVPAPEPQLSPVLQALLDRVLELLEAPNAERARQTFTRAFLETATEVKLLEILEQVHQLGPCRRDRVLSAGPAQATVRLVCGTTKVDAVMFSSSREPPYLLEGLGLSPVD